MKIAVASDHRGFNVKDRILSQIAELHHEAKDFGPSNADICDYPDFGARAAKAVSSGEVDRAILICGSGIGMCIVANKFKGVRAALCHDDLSAEMSRRHNDANVMCLSADLLGERLASRMIELWLSTPFEGGRHARRIAKIAEFEQGGEANGSVETAP
jgi:ribose 5-phosphate isomerase B